jgi:hypothetical protein
VEGHALTGKKQSNQIKMMVCDVTLVFLGFPVQLSTGLSAESFARRIHSTGSHASGECGEPRGNHRPVDVPRSIRE